MGELTASTDTVPSDRYQMAKDAINNANNIEAVPETPAIAIFDSEKLSNLILKDKVRHEDEYELAEGYTMDDAVVAVVYLPK